MLFWFLPWSPFYSLCQQISATSRVTRTVTLTVTVKLREMSFSQSHIGFYSPRSFPWWPGFTVSHSPADSEVLCAVITLPTVIKTHTVWGEHFICFAMVTNIATMRRLAQTVNLSVALTQNSPFTSSTSFWAARPCPCGHCQSASSLLKTSFGLGLQFLLAEVLAENASSAFKLLFKTPHISSWQGRAQTPAEKF